MKNLVIKTVVITLAAIVSFMAVVFCVLSVLIPKTVAGMLDNIGSKSASVFLYDLNYQRTNDINDLVDIIDKTYLDDYKYGQQKYVEQLIYGDEFSTFCRQKDSSTKSKVTTKEYYYGLYVGTLVETCQFDKAISVANEFIEQMGYTQFNPLNTILVEYKYKLEEQQLEVLEKEIQDAKCSENQQQFKNRDLKRFNLG